MKIKIGIAAAMLICLMLLTAGFPENKAYAAEAAVPCDYLEGYNKHYNNYATWAYATESYLAVTDDGYMRVQAGEDITVEYYNSDFLRTGTKTIPPELPLFGGFYETENNYFIVSGQTNPDESDEVEVYRITKYDKDWNRIGSAGIYGGNTTTPFKAGSCRMDHSGDYLVVRTCHEMYTNEDDGYKHQSNVTILLNMETMEITDSATAVSNNRTGYVSHSFNQFVKIDNNKIVAVDHGDAYPRSIVLLNYPTDISTGSFATYSCAATDILALQGDIGANKTRASVGGFEVTDTTYLTAGNSIVQDEQYASRTTRNIFVSSINKSTKANTVTWLTSDAEGDSSTNSTPYLVKVADNSYMVLWEKQDNVYYTFVDSTGTQQGGIYQKAGCLSDCQPIVNDGKVVWYTWYNEDMTFYTISISNPDEFTVNAMEYVHDYEATESDGKTATLTCTKCGDSKTDAIPTAFTLSWNNGSGYYYSNLRRFDPGVRTHYRINVTTESSDADFNEMVVSINGEEEDMATVDPLSYIAGYVTWNKEGPVTVEIYPKHNPSLKTSYTIWIGKMPVSEADIKIGSSSYKYDGTAKEPYVSASNMTKGTDYTVEYKDNVNAGTGKVIVTGTGNYTGTREFEFTIAPASLPSLSLETTAYTYSGEENRPAVVMTNGEEGRDFTVEYSNNINAGTGKAIITGTGNYTGTVTRTFTISRADISGKEMTLSQDTYTYDKTYHKPDVIIDGLTSGTDYTLSYSSNYNAGTATVKVTGIGNYTGSKSLTYTIEPAGISGKTATLTPATYTYSGSARKPSVTISGLTNGTHYTVEYVNNIDAGTAKAVITGKGNYKDTLEVEYKINPAGISGKTFTLSKTSFTYDGSAHEPVVTCSGLEEGKDFTVSYSDNVNAGTATATITGKGNYTGTKTYNYTINKAKMSTVNASLSESKYTYDGSSHVPEVTVEGLTEGADYEVEFGSDTINAGTVEVVLTGKGNYTGTKTLTYTIDAIDLSDKEVTLFQEEFIFNGEANKPEVEVEGLTEGRDYEVSYKNNIHAG